MKVLPITRNYHNQKNKLNFQTQKSLVQEIPPALSFKSAIGTVAGMPWIYKVWGIRAIVKSFSSYKNAKNVFELKKQLFNILDNPQNNLKKVLPMMATLSTLSNSSDKTFMYGLTTPQNIPTIEEMKLNVLTKIFPLLDDNNEVLRTAKKDYIQSMYETDNYRNNEFVEAFQNMPDSKYKDFKQSFMDNVMFSIRQSTFSKEPIKHIYNLILLNTLDRDAHAQYLQQRLSGFDKLVNNVSNAAHSRMTAEKNDAFVYYSKNFEHKIYSEDDELWAPFIENVFILSLKTSENDKKKLAEKLNINEVCAEDIIKDFQVFNKIEKLTNEAEKIALLKKRIKEKFEKDLLGENLNNKITSGRYNYWCNKETNLGIKIDNITNFIEKTPYNNDLKQIFENDLRYLRERLNYAKQRVKEEEEYMDNIGDVRC